MSDGFYELVHVPAQLRACSILAEIAEVEFGVV